jgi:hypothetical protein
MLSNVISGGHERDRLSEIIATEVKEDMVRSAKLKKKPQMQLKVTVSEDGTFKFIEE